MLKRIPQYLLLACSIALVGCSPQSDTAADGKGANTTGGETQAGLTASDIAQRVVRPAPDLDLAGMGLDGIKGKSGAGAYDTNAVGDFTVSFASDGFAKACAKVSSSAPNFMEFARLTPTASRIEMSLNDEQFCIANLESGKNYELQLMAGLPLNNAAGQSFKSRVTIKREIAVRDLGTALSFADNGFVLARGSSKGVPIFTTNVSEVELELVRVSERSLSKMIERNDDGLTGLNRYELDNLLSQAAVPVWKGRYTLNTPRNVRVEKALPIDKVLENLPEGLFILVAADARDAKAVLPSRIARGGDFNYNATAQWILSTNLGVSAAKYPKGMSISVRALDTAVPVRYAKVDLVTKANDVVFSGETDKDGVLNVPEPAVRGTRANAPSHLVVRSAKDFSFLVLDHAALDLSALDVQGRVLNTELDAYLFSDRGIYRPRETVHLTGLVRNRLATTQGVGAVDLVVTRPNGSVYQTLTPQLSETASLYQALQLPADAPRGSWRVDVKDKTDGATIGYVEIDVQDFIPERLKVEVAANDVPAKLGTPATFPLVAKFLYGAPGSDLGVEAEAVIREMRGAELADKGASAYVFGDALQPFSGESLKTSSKSTDEAGRSNVVAQTEGVRFARLDGFGDAVSPLVASVAIGVQEPGGRTTKAQGRQVLLANKSFIGVRSVMGGWVDTSTSAVFKVKLWDSAFSALPVETLQWQVQQMEWDWYYDRSANRWRYRDYIRPKVVAQGSVGVTQRDAPIGEIKLPNLSWGRYVVTVFDKASATYNRQTIYSGWSSNANASEPDFLEVKAQGKTFAPGELVDVGVKSPFMGLARLSVWTDREVFAQNVSVTKGENKFSIKTDDQWFPGAYVVVTAFRPTKSEEENVLSASRYMPVRTMGLVYLEADSNRRLKVSIPADKTLAPRMRETLQIKVPQLAGKQGYAVVQAVDEGILQLTRFKTPAPEGHFFAKRSLSPDFFDDYGKLLRGDGAVGDIRTGSDQAQGGAGGQSLPVVPTKSVVVYAGAVNLDINGNADVPINLPDFNGTLRTMVSVWSNDAFGSAAAEWVVRDPVVAEMVLPRYVAPGDTTVATLLLANTTDKETDVKAALSATGGLTLLSRVDSTVTLQAGERKQLLVKLRAKDTGIGGVSIDVRASNGFAHTKSWEIFSRYAGKGDALRSDSTTIPANGQRRVTVNMSSLQPSGRTGDIVINDEAVFSSADALRELIAYPWTCSEQTVSKAGPTIRAYQTDPTYVDQLARREHRQSAKDWLQANVDRIVSRQSTDGSIGLWRAGDDLVDPQLSTYLVDFLVTAELSGFNLPADSVATAYAWSYQLTQGSDLSTAEKLYVLSELVKAISPHTQRAVRLARTLADRSADANILTLSNLAVALRRFGDNTRADELVSRMNAKFASESAFKTPGYYDSDIARQGKLAENLFILKDPRASDVWANAVTRMKAYRYRWYSSVHEQGSLLRAKVAQSRVSPLMVELQGRTYTSFLGGISIPLDTDAVSGISTNLAVKSLTDRPLYAAVNVKAPPKPGVELGAVHGDFSIVRQVYEFDTGLLIDRFRKAKVNDRYVVVLRGSGRYDMGQTQVMMKDPVPAGFQIESVITPSIRSESFDWLPQLTDVDVTEVNDDAFFAANLDYWQRNDSMTVAYVIRATTPGTYLATQAVMEDMYAPQSSGSSSGAPVTVSP
jgi:alpha-2-macroglobulin